MDYVNRQVANNPDRHAILMPDSSCLTYQQLGHHIDKGSRYLLQHGLGNNKRIAVIMPNGPEMVVAFYAISNVAIYVPLNPAFPVEELKNYLEIIGVDAVMMKAGTGLPVNPAAHELALPVITMRPYHPGAAGSFELHTEDLPENETPFLYSGGDDTAVVMHTSGTTAKPKIVPLTHTNLCAVVEKNVALFDMTEKDRCINVIPQFHIYSIVCPILCTAAAGGSVICTETFDPGEFLRMIEEMSPTWYAASPATHQAILQYAEKERVIPVRHKLCRIQSGGAPLTADLAEKLKRYFGVMVIQGYGLTETSAMGTCNPPIPDRIKPNSVGMPVGCEISILDDDGHPLFPGQTGQILIKGPGVTAGYENDEEANDESFCDGWFATGDQGYLDEEGYLFITGRIKEMINRGGEKLSPYEVEEALSRHPDVSEAAVYAIPHGSLGEVPAAMVVLKPGSYVTPTQLKAFLRKKIALFKIPVKIKMVEKIPRGPAGKIQRSRLYQCEQDEAIGMASSSGQKDKMMDYVAPRTDEERKLADIWCNLLNIENIGVKDDFFDLGGDSLLFAYLIVEMERISGRRIPLNLIMDKWTIEQQVTVFSGQAEDGQSFSFLTPIQTRGSRIPLFCIHDIYGDVFSYRKVSSYLGPDQPVYGLFFNPDAEKLRHPVKVETLAQSYLQEIQSIRAQGPYLLVGHSLGGKIAYEMARQLRQQNHPVTLLAMLDTWLVPKKKEKVKMMERIREMYRKFSVVPLQRALPFLWEKIRQEMDRMKLRREIREYRLGKTISSGSGIDVSEMLESASNSYQPGCYEGKIIYFKAKEENRDSRERSDDTLTVLSGLVGEVQVYEASGDHVTMILEPQVAELTSQLSIEIQNALNRCD
jgi:oxalate---CoA ligase